MDHYNKERKYGCNKKTQNSLKHFDYPKCVDKSLTLIWAS